MARKPGSDAVYKAADFFRDRCLRNHRSLLWPDQQAWTSENLGALHKAFLGDPDLGHGDFFSKWQDQLRDQPVEVHRIAVDLLVFYYLYPSSVTDQKKLEEIVDVIRWKIGQVPDMGFIEQAFAESIGNPGAVYLVKRDRQIAFFLEFSQGIHERYVDPADQLASQTLADEVVTRQKSSIPSRNILLHLLFPDQYEPIASAAHKRRIVQQFSQHAGATDDLDMALANIRQALAKDSPSQFDFYAPEVKALWLPKEDPEDLAGSFLAVMTQYYQAKTVFLSMVKGQRFFVSAVDDAGCVVERVDAREPIRCEADLYRRRLKEISQAGGQLPVDALGNTLAIRATLLQGKEVGVTQDRRYVLDLTDEGKALDNFIELLKNLRVGYSPGQERKYKPALIACVLDGLETGELTKNRVTFDWIAPRFLERLRLLGVQATETQAAYAFYHLASDLFWLLCPVDSRSSLEGAITPALIREKFDAAMIKPTYWTLLNQSEARARVMAALAERWWPEQGKPSFWWVNQGQTRMQEEKGGYLWVPTHAKNGQVLEHHQNVAKLKTSDIILHYADGEIWAISIVTKEARESQRPEELPTHLWGEDGYLVLTRYQRLESPIRLADIPAEWRTGEAGPFAQSGAVKEVYFSPLSDGFVTSMCSHFRDHLPSILLDRCQLTLGPVYSEPPFDRIVQSVIASGMRISERMLRRYHLALKTRGFVMLSGVSGTGKTWLTDVYAAAVGARYAIVSVAPNWTTNEDLLGYYNTLDNQYYDTPFSRFLREASQEFQLAQADGRTPRPYHLALDEMNLARVEYYFAKFLSAMEVRVREGKARIALGPKDHVDLPPNLVFIGTVNIDETTHGFTEKVHDRAQLIELEAPRDALVAHLGPVAYADTLMNVWDTVYAVAPFAFRVIDEIKAYISRADSMGISWQDALDEQLLQKVLPKLRGTDSRVGDALERFIGLTATGFPLSHEKARAILQRFQQHGFASYF